MTLDAIFATLKTGGTDRADQMEIAENTAQRVTLVERLSFVDAFFLCVALVVLISVVLGDTSALVKDGLNLALPGWAEAHGLSREVWRTGTSDGHFAWSDAGGRPLSRVVSLLVSVISLACSLLLLGTAYTAFPGRKSLTFDRVTGQVTMTRRGLFGLRERSRTNPAFALCIDDKTDGEDGSCYKVLTVTAARPDGDRAWFGGAGRRITLWSPRIEPEQVRELAPLLQVPPGT